MAKNAALWIFQVVLALLFLLAGGAKLAGAEPMVQMFETIGVGQWFRYVTGTVEVGSAILLLVPALSGVGALFLICTMIGAIMTHLFVIGGSPGGPIVLLALSIIVALGRRDRIRALWTRSAANDANYAK